MRRALLASGIGIAMPRPGLADGSWPAVRPGRRLVFPRDHGAHPEYRTEWWYLTAWLTEPDGSPVGMQLTFFRRRTRHDPRNPSRFAPTQLIFAHAAISSTAEGRVLHAERSARTGFGIARCLDHDMDLVIGDWQMRNVSADTIIAGIEAAEFGFRLEITAPGTPHLQGDEGFSRKGPKPGQASMYYSRPQLGIDAWMRGPSKRAMRQLRGTGWLDHEWSSEILDAEAVGWDWVGLNLDDGGALMAFRIRRADGSTLWSEGRWIGADVLRQPTTSRPGEDPAAWASLSGATVPGPEFEAVRTWLSPRTGARWPVAMRVRHAGRELMLQPLLDDQEIDASLSTGTVYWEGAVTAIEQGRKVGRGYLELTGYARPLRL